MCLVASSVKIITKHIAASSQPRLFHAETYMHVLGLWFTNTAGAKIAMKQVW